MSDETVSIIRKMLSRRGIGFRHLAHDTIPASSREASMVRGTEHEKGAKALIAKCSSGKVIQIVIPAHHRIRMKSLKRTLDEKNIMLISPDKVYELTDCIIGGVPPFGSLWNIEVVVARSLLDNEHIVCSGGTREDSFIIPSISVVELNDAIVADISRSVSE